jgi:hypothetical protein
MNSVSGSTGVDLGFAQYASPAYLFFINEASSSTELDDSNTMSSGSWYHIVATWDGTNQVIYVNGSEVAGPQAATLTAGTGVMCIGQAAAGAAQFGGYICQVAVYPTALSSTRVNAHYTAGIA